MTTKTWLRWGSSIAAVALMSACSGGLGSSDIELLESARSHLEKRDVAAAEIQLKSALQKNPQNAEARSLLAELLLARGDGAGAEIEFRKALEAGAAADDMHPGLAASMLAQGKLREVVQQFGEATYAGPAVAARVKVQVATAQLALGQRDQGRQSVQAALEQDPDLAEAKLLRARLLAGDGDLPRALDEVESVLARDASHLGALLLKGDLLRFGSRDLPGAGAAYAEALRVDPRAAPAHAALVAMAFDQREIDAARKAFETMRTALPNAPETRLFEAQFAILDGDFARARTLTTELLRIAPNDLRVVQAAGLAELRLGGLAQAEAHFLKVMAGQPAALAPRQLLAGIYNRTGQPSKTLEILRPVIDSRAADGQSLTLAGEALLQTGDLPGAEALFQRATAADPNAAQARAALALGQVARGNRSDGFAELETVAASDPGIRTNLALIAARMRTNDLPAALRAIDDLEKKQPDRPIAHALRGNVRLQQRDPIAAAAAFEQALRLDPQYYPAAAGLAAIEMQAGRPQAAQARFEAMLQRDPRNFRAMLGIAQVKALSGAGKDELAKLLEDAVRAAPAELQPRSVLVNHLLSHRDLPAALAAAQAAAAALPNSVEAQDLLGTAQLAAGEHQQAIATFSRVASQRPDHAEPELKLAEAHAATGDIAAARRSLNKALEIRPGLFAANRALAILALREDKPQDAVAVARRMQREAPRQAAGWLLEADIHLQRARTEDVIAALRNGLQNAPSTEIAARLHRTLLAAQRRDEADRVASTWTREQPGDAAFRFYLGDMALGQGDLAAAERHYRGVLQVLPDNALAMNNVAWILTERRSPEGLAMARRANELLPDQPQLMDTLALALAKARQGGEAVTLQRRAIERAPNDPNLKLTLAKIHIENGEQAQAREQLQALAALGDGFRQQAEVRQLLGTL